MKNKVLQILFISLLIIAQSCVNSTVQDTTLKNDQEIEAFIKYSDTHNIFNGAVLVIKNDTLIYKKSIGFENHNTKDTLQENSKFLIASLTKPITGVAIMQLKEKGLLQYDEPISKYLTEFSPKSNHISIRHLLTHTSGIPNHYDLDMQKKGMTNSDVLAEIIKHELLFEPGSKFRYSNSGYILLAMILEKVTKQSYREYMQENIFMPLEMNNSIVLDETNPTIVNLVQGITRYGGPHNYPFFTTGSTGIYATTHDLMLFDRALYSNEIIKQETLKEAFKPFELNDGTMSNYGFGWHIIQNDKNEPEKVFHTGGAAGYTGFFFRDIKEKHLVVFLASNRETFNLGAFADALTAKLYDKKITTPKIPISLRLYDTIKQNNKINIEATFNFIQENDTIYKIEEDDLNTLGYHFLENNQAELANDIFKINVELFPTSWNVYDSYGESFLRLNDIENAKKNYLKSLQLNSEIKDPKEHLKKISDKF